MEEEPSTTNCCCFSFPSESDEHIDPKTFLANERTFISWLHMAVTLGTVSTTLVAIGQASHASVAAMQIMASCLILTAIFLCFYSMKVFFARNRVIRQRHDMTQFDDLLGPVAVTILITGTWATVFAMTLVKLAANDSVHTSLKTWLSKSL